MQAVKKFYILEEHVYTEGSSMAVRGGYDGGDIFDDLDKAVEALTAKGGDDDRILYEGHFEDGRLVTDRAIRAAKYSVEDRCYREDPELADWVNKNWSHQDW